MIVSIRMLNKLTLLRDGMGKEQAKSGWSLRLIFGPGCRHAIVWQQSPQESGHWLMIIVACAEARGP